MQAYGRLHGYQYYEWCYSKPFSCIRGWYMTVELSELQTALSVLFSHLQQQGVRSVEVEQDYYWNIQLDEVYDPLKDPKNFDLGQLTHDWEQLQSIADGSSPAIGYGLVWAAALLRYIGESNVA